MARDQYREWSPEDRTDAWREGDREGCRKYDQDYESSDRAYDNYRNGGEFSDPKRTEKGTMKDRKMIAAAEPQKAAGVPVELKHVVGPAHDEMKIYFDSRCLGRMRSSGDIILLLLGLDKGQAPEILADVIREAGIDIDEVVGWYHDKPCPECGCSLMAHQNGMCG